MIREDCILNPCDVVQHHDCCVRDCGRYKMSKKLIKSKDSLILELYNCGYIVTIDYELSVKKDHLILHTENKKIIEISKRFKTDFSYWGEIH